MSQSAKTRPPSARRLLRARRQGDHPISQAALALGASLGLVLTTTYLATQAYEKLQQLLSQAIVGESTTFTVLHILDPIASIALPLVGSTMLGALAVGLVQTRGHLSLAPLRSLPSSIARVPTLLARRFLTAVAGLATFSLMLLWALNTLQNSGQQLAKATGNIATTLRWLTLHGKQTLSLVLAVGLMAAVMDIFLRRSLWLRRNRMSSEELSQEQREAEADPNLRHLRRQAHQQALRETEIERLTQAALLVVGPGWVTTALAYRPSLDTAPFVLLQGAGAIGTVMQSEAKKLSLPFLHDPQLSKALSALAPDEPIPESSFAAIATAIATNDS